MQKSTSYVDPHCSLGDHSTKCSCPNSQQLFNQEDHLAECHVGLVTWSSDWLSLALVPEGMALIQVLSLTALVAFTI